VEKGDLQGAPLRKEPLGKRFIYIFRVQGFLARLGGRLSSNRGHHVNSWRCVAVHSLGQPKKKREVKKEKVPEKIPGERVGRAAGEMMNSS